MGEAELLNGNRLRFVRNKILKWYEQNGRDFVWRQTSNPFQILIAEIDASEKNYRNSRVKNIYRLHEPV
jgi:adenine-specific DNA glycosylase